MFTDVADNTLTMYMPKSVKMLFY